MITMFEIHLANFAPACRVLVDYCGEGYAYLFLSYRCIAGFAVLNVIHAVFIQQTIKVAQQDHDVMVESKRTSQAHFAGELRLLFKSLDSSGDGLLSWDEFEASCHETSLKLWMDALEVDTSVLHRLFKLMDVDGDMTITVDELILGASRIRGEAKSIDIIRIQV